jgi:hypothetical protein
MSYNGNNNYNDRKYTEEKLIRIENYIDKNNNIEDSFIKERLDNSKYYKKFVSREDY